MEIATLNNLFSLSGKVALVTGATGGLGSHISLTLAAFGAAVIISDVDAEECSKLKNEILRNRCEVEYIVADLTNETSTSAMTASAIDWKGRIDVLVCCAGVEGPMGSLLDVTEVEWKRTMDINVQSSLWICKQVCKQMAQQNTGSVILISSIAALRGNRFIGLYAITKAALSQMARNLAIELGPSGVRVNSVAPGLIETPLSYEFMSDQAFMTRRMSMTPLRRVGTPHEISGVVVMLASDAGAFITGQTVVVDGGTLISDGN